MRQTLTLAITDIELIPLHVNVTNSSVVPDTATVRGLWQGRVTVTPIAGTSSTLRIPAQTHGKLSIQPLRLDVSPSSPPGFDYSSGGIRIVLRMSGLTPGTPPAGGFATKDPNPPDGSGASGSGDQTSLSAAGYAGMLPAFVYVLDAQGMPPQSQITVDASGASEFELIYILSLLPLQGPLTLTFDSITLYSGEKIPGPWVFTIPGA